jgi:hypothetical protein
MEKNALEWLIDQVEDYIGLIPPSIVEKAKEIEYYNEKVNAKMYYLKGFEVAELTEKQNVSHQQTMRDAESFFEIIYPLK